MKASHLILITEHGMSILKQVDWSRIQGFYVITCSASNMTPKTFTHTHTHTHTHLYFMSPHEVPPFPCPLSYLGLDALPFIQDKSIERGVSSAPCSKVYLLDSRHHLYVIDSQIHSPCTDLFFGSRPIASSLPHHLEISKVVRSTKEPNRTNSPGNQF